jgi:hypothetical protein
MAQSDKLTRRTEESERARHIAAGETITLGTTAGTMLLGLLAGLEEAQARHDPADRGAPPQAPVGTAPAPPASADHLSPAPASHDVTPGDVEQHAGTLGTPPAQEPLPGLHADLAAESSPAPELAGAAMVHSLLGSLPEWEGSAAPADQGFSRGAGSVGDTLAPATSDLSGIIHQFAETITGIVDATLTAVSQTMLQLGESVGQFASSLTGTFGHLADGLTGTLSNLTHDPAPATTGEPLSLSASSHATDGIIHPHDTPLLDTAGAIPMTLFHPLPLQLGFLGQPTLDGHDPHDGAFSALGVHHF